MQSEEIWKNVADDDAYQVSNTGLVRSRLIVSSKVRNKQNTYHEIKSRLDSNGYLSVDIYGKNRKVHRLVAETFIPNPKSLPVVRHVDDNKRKTE